MSHLNDGKSLGAVGWECHAHQAGPLDLEEIAAVISAEVRRRDVDIVPKLHLRIEQKDRDIAGWRSQAQAAQKKVVELEREVNKLNRDAAIRYGLTLSSEQKVIELTAEIERLKEITTKYEARHANHQAENERLVNCIKDKYKALDAADSEIERLNKSIEILRPRAEHFSQLTEVHAKLREEHDKLKADYDAVKAEHDRLYKLNVESIDADSNALRSLIALQYKSIAAQQTSIEELRAEAKNRPNAELREFTKLAMQALSSTCDGYETKREDLASSAVKLAKATLAELAKEGAE